MRGPLRSPSGRGWPRCYSHCTERLTEARQVHKLPKILQLLNDRACCGLNCALPKFTH